MGDKDDKFFRNFLILGFCLIGVMSVTTSRHPLDLLVGLVWYCIIAFVVLGGIVLIAALLISLVTNGAENMEMSLSQRVKMNKFVDKILSLMKSKDKQKSKKIND